MLLEIRYVKTVIINTETNEIVSAVETVENKMGVSTPISASTSKKATRASKVVQDVDNSDPSVKVEDGKLVLNPTMINKLNLVTGDRVSINYVDKGNGELTPVIAKADVYGDSSAGNKLTKAGTVSFKGKQAISLLTYGKSFIVDETVLDVAEGAVAIIDPNAEVMISIKEEELAPMPEITSSDDFLNFDENSLENNEETATFGFDLNELGLD